MENKNVMIPANILATCIVISSLNIYLFIAISIAFLIFKFQEDFLKFYYKQAMVYFGLFTFLSLFENLILSIFIIPLVLILFVCVLATAIQAYRSKEFCFRFLKIFVDLIRF